MREVSQELDVLTLMAECTAQVMKDVAVEQARTEFTIGQLDFWKQLLGAVSRSKGASPPNEVLASVAKGFKLEQSDQGMNRLPSSQRELGIITAWMLALGMAVGIPKGVETAVASFADLTGIDSDVSSR